MIRPFIEQATPHGQAMDNETNGFGSAPSSSRDSRPADQTSSQNSQPSPKKSEVKEYIGFTAELTTDRVLPKIRELSSKQDRVGFSDEQLAKIGYLLDKVAMLDVKVCFLWVLIWHKVAVLVSDIVGRRVACSS